MKNWENKVYSGIAEVWLGRKKSGEKCNAIEIANMLERDIKTGKFLDKLLDAGIKNNKTKFWLLCYKIKGLFKNRFLSRLCLEDDKE